MCQLSEVLEHRVQLGLHPLHLRAAVARVQGGEFDGDARPFVYTPPGGCLADGVDGLLVVAQVTLGVCRGQRGLAQHVIGITKALRLQRAGVAQRLGDGFAGDELLTHHAHGHVHTLADQPLAALGGDAPQRRAQAGFAVGGHQLAGKQQAPGGGVDEQRGAFAQVRLPLAVGDLVADECVAGGSIGDTQQRLGQAHQRHTFLRRQGKFLQQPLHNARPPHRRLAPTQRASQPQGQSVGGLRHRLGQPRLRQHSRHGLRLGQAPGGGDGAAQGLRGGGKRRQGKGGSHGGLQHKTVNGRMIPIIQQNICSFFS